MNIPAPVPHQSSKLEKCNWSQCKFESCRGCQVWGYLQGAFEILVGTLASEVQPFDSACPQKTTNQRRKKMKATKFLQYSTMICLLGMFFAPTYEQTQIAGILAFIFLLICFFISLGKFLGGLL